jgi:glyoxylase-like metal-dependent hydrolase (beta-lactamase superfamily II)
MPLLLPAGNASGWTGPAGNNTWLLRGRVPTLIDAGVGNAAHLDALAGALGGQPLALVLITHGHVDHASGATAVRERWPAVRIRRFGNDGDGLQPDERIAAGDRMLRVIHTPGHSPDHCCFLLEDTGEVFCGDLARLGGSVVIPASKGGDLSRYLESLRRIRELHPARMYPGHGDVIEEPERLIEAYLRHRQERDAQVLTALAEGCRTAREIVRHVYRGLPEFLQNAAEDTVLAHLIKLRAEGRASGDSGGWRAAG